MAFRSYLIVAGVLLKTTLSHALEALDEAAMSSVTGQAQGVRFTTEFVSSAKSITYYDDNGVGTNGKLGSLSLSSIRIATPTNRPLIMEMRVGEKSGRKGLFLESKDLPVDIEIGSVAVNGKSLGGFGQTDFKIANNQDNDASNDQLYAVDIYAGGSVGNGITLDMSLPGSLSFDAYYEDDGVRFSSTVDFGNPFDSTQTGINMKGLTLDLVADGLEIGLPTISKGNVNVYNARVGSQVLNSAAYRNINLQPGGSILLKNAKTRNDIGLEIDLTLKKDSSFDFVYISGEVDNDYLNANASGLDDVYEATARIKLLSDLTVKGMRLNVDEERGLVLDFDPAVSTDGAKAHILASDITLRRADRVVNNIPAQSIGTIDAQLNITSNSYLQVEGH